MISAADALKRLRDGNARFVSNVRDLSALASQTKRADLLDGQEPFAIILGCSDSRVPAEMIFDQGLGDLFVIRVAGNIIAPSLVGSVEFAAQRFGTRLVIVLGHTMCGAVIAAVEEHGKRVDSGSGNIRSIVDRIRPSVETVIEAGGSMDKDELVRQVTHANIRASAAHLCHGSELLEDLIESHDLRVVAAEYSLETGRVEFFEDVSSPAT